MRLILWISHSWTWGEISLTAGIVGRQLTDDNKCPKTIKSKTCILADDDDETLVKTIFTWGVLFSGTSKYDCSPSRLEVRDFSRRRCSLFHDRRRRATRVPLFLRKREILEREARMRETRASKLSTFHCTSPWLPSMHSQSFFDTTFLYRRYIREWYEVHLEFTRKVSVSTVRLWHHRVTFSAGFWSQFSFWLFFFSLDRGISRISVNTVFLDANYLCNFDLKVCSLDFLSIVLFGSRVTIFCEVIIANTLISNFRDRHVMTDDFQCQHWALLQTCIKFSTKPCCPDTLEM